MDERRADEEVSLFTVVLQLVLASRGSSYGRARPGSEDLSVADQRIHPKPHEPWGVRVNGPSYSTSCLRISSAPNRFSSVLCSHSLSRLALLDFANHVQEIRYRNHTPVDGCRGCDVQPQAFDVVVESHAAGVGSTRGLCATRRVKVRFHHNLQMSIVRAPSLNLRSSHQAGLAAASTRPPLGN